MIANILAILMGVLVVGIGIWCWWFENHGHNDDADQKGEDEK